MVTGEREYKTHLFLLAAMGHRVSPQSESRIRWSREVKKISGEEK